MVQSDMILSGPESVSEDFIGSIAEYIIPKLMSHPKDNILQVDTETGETITCHEFLKLSLELTEGLIKFGVKPGDIVAHICGHSIRSHISAMAVMFSGAVFTPLNQSLKPLEMQYLLYEFMPAYILCEDPVAKRIKNDAKSINLNCKIIVIDPTDNTSSEFFTWNDIRTEVNVENYTPLGVENPKKALSTILCSSGTTGMSKGVALPHCALIYGLQASIGAESIDFDNKLLFTSPLYWISGHFFLLLTCLTGNTCYLVRTMTPKNLLESIQKYKANILFLSPALHLFLVEHPDFKKYDLSSINLLVSGGSTLPDSVAKKIKESWDNVVFFQGYGMTETGGTVTIPSSFEDYSSVGKLIAGVRMKVVDLSTGEILGPNKIGEGRFKTKSMMAGYYNKEKETKESFDEDGWFRSGDLVYYNEKGMIYVVGRIKEVIKYRNHQISPLELESFLLNLPGVKDAAIAPVPHETDTYHLRAIIVKDSRSKITEQDIIQGIKDNFSDHKHLRAGVQFVEALPRTETGKLKRGEVQKMAQVK